MPPATSSSVTATDLGTGAVGIFGGSGLYSLLDEVEQIELRTPYGAPSGPIAVGFVPTANGGRRRVVFLPRHGVHHEWPPHRINYRANLWAFRELGVTRLLAPFACGSLQPHVHPGDLVVCDQLVDRTSGRAGTFFDGPTVYYLSLADPYCPQLRQSVITTAAAAGELPVHEQGTVVVIDGPRFSTRAESAFYRGAGWDVINMTHCPEIALARELGMCAVGLAIVTDYDTGVVDTDVPVSQEAVFAAFEANLLKLRRLLEQVVKELPEERDCECAKATGGVVPDPPAASPPTATR
jgi:5'-methylthioadenosine phosphorylase